MQPNKDYGWKFRFAATCLSQTVRYCMAHKTPNYSTFLELDRRIRTFPVPTHLISPMNESGRGWPSDPAHAMQQYSVVVERESSMFFGDFPPHRCSYTISRSTLSAQKLLGQSTQRSSQKSHRSQVLAISYGCLSECA